MRNSGINAGGVGFDRIFKALGDPHRIQIIELLRERELSAGEILDTIDIVQSTLSHHMKTLTDSGAVNAVRRGKWTYYSINTSAMSDAAVYLQSCAEGTRIMRKDSDLQHDEKTKAGRSLTGKNESGGNVKDPVTVKSSVKDSEKAGKKKEKKGKKNKKNKK